MFMCGRCDNKQLCTACDERWHQHPKRKNHDRQQLQVLYNHDHQKLQVMYNHDHQKLQVLVLCVFIEYKFVLV